MAKHDNAHTSPKAPTADKPNEIAELARPQYALTVFENSKQKAEEIIKVIPIKTKANGRPSNNENNSIL